MESSQPAPPRAAQARSTAPNPGSSFSPTGYRIQESINVSTNPSGATAQDSITAMAGKTVNFVTPFYNPFGGPLPNITAGQFLEANPFDITTPGGTPAKPTYPWEFQCTAPTLENAFGKADLSMVGGTSTSSTTYNTVITEFKGIANDPLEPNLTQMTNGVVTSGINWDLDVSINTSNNTATISGWNTCYPAHQIWVGSVGKGVLIYDSQPEMNNTPYLVGCLTGLRSHRQLATSCTVPLDGSKPPCMPQ